MKYKKIREINYYKIATSIKKNISIQNISRIIYMQIINNVKKLNYNIYVNLN